MTVELSNTPFNQTQAVELAFLERYKLTPYVAHKSTSNTVIHSETLGRHYEWPENATVRDDVLRVFKDCGHTLAIDYTKTYVRKFSLEINCACQRNPSSTHANDALANNIKSRVEVMLKRTTNNEPPQCAMWKNSCSYHLYSDVSVSLPLHLLVAKHLSINFQEHNLLIEVPPCMPLPYSAKGTSRPYQPMILGQASVELVGRYPFFECITLQHVSSDSLVATIIAEPRPVYVCTTNNTRLVYSKPKFPSNISSVTLGKTFSYMNQLEEFIVQSNRRVAKTLADGGDPTEIELRDLDSRSKEKFREFIVSFNISHFNRSDLSLASFVRVSASDNGGLYLQPYTVAMHKSLEPITVDAFKSVLRTVYKEVASVDETVARFIDMYEVHTYNSYLDTATEMMAYLSYLFINNISPFLTIDARINEVMSNSLHIESPERACKRLQGKKREEKKEVYDQLVRVYVDVMARLKILMYNESTLTWYVANDNGFYKSCKSLTDSNLPCIGEWTGYDKLALDMLGQHLYSRKSFFKTTDLWPVCEFMFATMVGVFNSVTGLYTANTAFLRFVKTRKYAIWDITRPLKSYDKQNHDILKLSYSASRYVNILTNRLTEVFTHFQLAPAVIQLRDVYDIEEFRLTKFFALIQTHTDLRGAYFLVEYYPIDPKFIYIIMYLYDTNELESLLSYEKLVDRVFRYEQERVGENEWRNKFAQQMATLKYDEDEKSYMGTLLSMNGERVRDVSAQFCFYAVIIAVCMIKCRTFETLVRAFGVSRLPPPKSEHPRYSGVKFVTNLACLKKNFERTLDIVFGSNLNYFERCLTEIIVKLGMSTAFDSETTIELVNMVSAIFVPINKNKKLFIFFGKKDTGKSLICNWIQELNSPDVARLTRLEEAVERANITMRHNVTIINEVNTLDSSHIKSITGNDAESMKKFFSQEYELQRSQSLVYGATNNIIKFYSHKSRNMDTDKTTIDRIHAIELRGQQTSEAEYSADSFFMMMTESKFYEGIMNCKESHSANALAWITYVAYYHNRDQNFRPVINVHNRNVKAYKANVYFNNNELYAFMVRSGLTEAEGFTMCKEVLINTVKRSIEDKISSTITKLSDFKLKFSQHYNLALDEVSVVQNIQYTALIQHIQNNMSTIPSQNGIITRDDIDARLKLYNTVLDRENASVFFKLNNKMYYDPTDGGGVYRGVCFAKEDVGSYEIRDETAGSSR
uniref:Helicase n=1 Tax=Venturia canescens TaxID=32260 RepID=A0A0U1ZLA9_9HYME|nr:helicase [Venturia canescens]